MATPAPSLFCPRRSINHPIESQIFIDVTWSFKLLELLVLEGDLGGEKLQVASLMDIPLL